LLSLELLDSLHTHPYLNYFVYTYLNRSYLNLSIEEHRHGQNDAGNELAAIPDDTVKIHV
jgi:hypothetical protein